MTVSSVSAQTAQEVPQVFAKSDNNSTSKSSTATVPDDKVELSVAAKAKLLEHQGQSVSQIATSLALTTKTVNDYLGITDTEVQALTALVKIAAH